MKEFTKLHLANYGKASKLIQGECGWGTENSSLDKTGYRKYTYYKPHTNMNGSVDCLPFELCSKSPVKDQC
ncbi:MAG: hypothetical protein E6Z86_17670 [Clostridium butyricum]|nr:hypothetical protein [Clostridium butyricum]MDU5821799.1 hypothetical protein [Clostridium butyricum]